MRFGHLKNQESNFVRIFTSVPISPGWQYIYYGGSRTTDTAYW